jgi:hypothetical protein
VFEATVESLETRSHGTESGIPVNVDPRFDMAVRICSVEGEGTPLKAGERQVFAIHSPSELMWGSPQTVVGRRYRFSVLWRPGPPGKWRDLRASEISADALAPQELQDRLAAMRDQLKDRKFPDQERAEALLSQMLDLGGLLLDDPSERSRRLRQEALCIIRDQYATPALVRATSGVLGGLLERQAANWEEAAPRFAACDILRKYTDWCSIPALLKALEEPFTHRLPDAGLQGANYRAIWWNADEALRGITRTAPIPVSRRDLEPTKGEQAKVLAAWQAWWAERPGDGLLSRGEIVACAKKAAPSEALLVNLTYYPDAIVDVDVKEGRPLDMKVNRQPQRFQQVWLARWHGWWAGDFGFTKRQTGSDMHLLDAKTGTAVSKDALEARPNKP